MDVFTVTYRLVEDLCCLPTVGKAVLQIDGCSNLCCVSQCESLGVTSQHTTWQPEPLWHLLLVTDL